jgi:hypothetical protein
LILGLDDRGGNRRQKKRCRLRANGIVIVVRLAMLIVVDFEIRVTIYNFWFNGFFFDCRMKI